jgi:hypothetical protein
MAALNATCMSCVGFAHERGTDRVVVARTTHYIPRGWLMGATCNDRMSVPEALDHWHTQCAADRQRIAR